MRFLILLLGLQTSLVFAAPRVVTSLPPIQELTTIIMAGVTQPTRIVNDSASTHHFAFKPSHLRLLQQADLVIWIDRHFEAGFYRLPDMLTAAQQSLELLPALGIDSEDGHIWYSPQLLLRSIDLITAAVIQLDPVNQASYQRNAHQLAVRIRQWRKQNQALWQNLNPQFVTDHAFTTHFETEFGITPVATIHNQHDAQAGLDRLRRIEQRLQQYRPTCLLTLAHQPSKLVQNLAQKHHLQIVNLIQPHTVDATQPAIIQRLENLSRALQSCQ